MKFTLFLALFQILLLCGCQNANGLDSGFFGRWFGKKESTTAEPFVDVSPSIPETDFKTSGDPEPLPYYPKPNQYPSGISLSYGPEQAIAPIGATSRKLTPEVPIAPRALDTKSTATDDEILQLTENLYTKENSQIDQVAINLQGKTRSVDINDQAPMPLLKVSEKALKSPTIAKLKVLFDNYEMDTSVNEVVTPNALKEEDDFLDAVMASNVMRQTMAFLQSKGIVSSNPKAQRDLLKTIWFNLYSRGQGKLGSSGFEHVFVNEINKGKIIGLHNWVYFNEEEQAGRLDYKGYMHKVDLGNKGKIIDLRFEHNGLMKPVNTLFVGTSPELELALYTICFELRPDEICPVSLGGTKFKIQTYSWRYNGKVLIGSAFPKI